MAIRKPIVLLDEGLDTQAHGELPVGDTLPVSTLPVSSDADNAVEAKADGLFVAKAAVDTNTKISAVDSSLVSRVSGQTGLSGQPIMMYFNDVKVTDTDGNSFTARLPAPYTKVHGVGTWQGTREVDGYRFTLFPEMRASNITPSFISDENHLMPGFFTEAVFENGKLKLTSRFYTHGTDNSDYNQAGEAEKVSTFFVTETDVVITPDMLKLSAEQGNAITAKADGLYVAKPTDAVLYEVSAEDGVKWDASWAGIVSGSGYFYKQTVKLEDSDGNESKASFAVPALVTVSSVGRSVADGVPGTGNQYWFSSFHQVPDGAGGWVTKEQKHYLPFDRIEKFEMAADGTLTLGIAAYQYNVNTKEIERHAGYEQRVQIPGAAEARRVYQRPHAGGISVQIERDPLTRVQIVRISATVASSLSYTPISWADFPFSNTAVLYRGTVSTTYNNLTVGGCTIRAGVAGPMQIVLEGRY